MTAEPSPRGINVAAVVFAVLLIFTAGIVVFSIPVGVVTVYFGKLSSVYDYSAITTPFLWIGPAFVSLQFGVSVGALFAVLTAIYAAMLAYSLVQRRRIGGALSAAAKEGFGPLFSSPFAVVVISIGFLAFSGSLIDSVVSGAGVPVGNLQGDPLGLLLGFTASPLVEEFGFRVVLVGAVALVLSIGRPWREAARSLWRPSAVYEGAVVATGASMIIWLATGLSAVTFGACHVLCGNSWDIGKFPEAAYGGFVLGYLYVKYGFHVAVLCHWGIDFVGSVYSFFGQSFYGIPWNSSTKEVLGQALYDYDMLLLFGLASFLVVVYLGVRRYTGRTRQVEPVLPESLKAEPPGV